jgi:tRNA nucleotidyltransferase (CCA-adding enzyme)
MSDYNFLMESRLSPEQYRVIALVSRLSAEQGLNLYLVGGAVRDLTYGQQVVRDLDFAVEGPPQRILRALPRADTVKAGRGTRGPAVEATLTLEFQEYDDHLNSSELVFSNDVRAELSMCREEVYTRPGQRAEVRPAMVFDDLKRRDFAIDAMAVSLHPNSRGLLLDPTNGAGDIERHEIRALQSRCFIDDPSRIYRLLRLSVRFDFKPDERTQRWLDAALEDGAWERLDADQQARELAAILHEEHPDRILKLLFERKLIAGLDKKLATVHLAYDRFARIRNVLQNAPGADPFLLNFHCLVEKMGGEQKARLAKKIIRDSKTIKLALGIEHDAKKLEHVLSGAKATLPSQVYTILAPQPQPLLFYVLASTKSAKVQNRIKSFLFKFPEVRSRLPRADLQALGVPFGPEFDRILAQIFALQLDGKIKSHSQLMKEMRELAGIKEPPPPPPPPPAPAGRRGKGKPHEAASVHHQKGKGTASIALPAPESKVKASTASAVSAGMRAEPAKAAATRVGAKWGASKSKPASAALSKSAPWAKPETAFGTVPKSHHAKKMKKH